MQSGADCLFVIVITASPSSRQSSSSIRVEPAEARKHYKGGDFFFWEISRVIIDRSFFR